MGRKIILLGASGHAKVVRNIIHSMESQVIAVFDDKVKHWQEFKNIKPIFMDKTFLYPFIVTIGDNRIRKSIASNVSGTSIVVTHEKSYVEGGTKIGEGTCIMAGTIIQTDAIIGRHCIINTSSTIDHDCIIDDFCHISPNSTLCGGVKVGEGSHIGAGSVVIPNIKIGKWCVIGAGAVIVNDIPDGSTVVGNPGRIIKTLDIYSNHLTIRI